MFRHVEPDIVWKVIDRTRRELGLYLQTLPDSQWDQPSQCKGWRVRDVVAHLIIEYQYKRRDVVSGLVRHHGNVNTFIEKTAVQFGQQPNRELMLRFMQLIGDRRQPASGPLNVLADVLVHEQDIRIALGNRKPMDRSSVELIFSNWDLSSFNFGERLVGVGKRMKGLNFQATDILFEVGSGQPVKGEAEQLLLAITGRESALGYLTGDGVGILRSRVK